MNFTGNITENENAEPLVADEPPTISREEYEDELYSMLSRMIGDLNNETCPYCRQLIILTEELSGALFIFLVVGEFLQRARRHHPASTRSAD